MDSTDSHVKFHEPPKLEVGEKVSVTIGGVIAAHGIVDYLGSGKENKLWERMIEDEGKTLVLLINPIVLDVPLTISNNAQRQSNATVDSI